MFKGIGRVFGALALVVSFGFVSSAQALQFDQNVTSNAIFGTGNVNGAFTTDRANGIELGLRGKVRFNSTNAPENIFNSNGAGSYAFDSGAPSGGVPSSGFGFAPDNPQTAKWNFEWSVNSSFDGNGGNLNDFIYVLQIDGNPTGAVDFGLGGFDMINVGLADHSIGDNSTLQAQGAEAMNAADYAALISNNNLAQNSWNYLFFTPGFSAPLSQLASFNPNTPGTYTINLSAFSRAINGSADQLLATTSIDINVGVVPLPAALPLYGTGLALMGFVGWRRRKAATA